MSNRIPLIEKKNTDPDPPENSTILSIQRSLIYPLKGLTSDGQNSSINPIDPHCSNVKQDPAH